MEEEEERRSLASGEKQMLAGGEGAQVQPASREDLGNKTGRNQLGWDFLAKIYTTFTTFDPLRNVSLICAK